MDEIPRFWKRRLRLWPSGNRLPIGTRATTTATLDFVRVPFCTKLRRSALRYHAPNTFEAAAKLAASAPGPVRFLAGGTDVIVQMRLGLFAPADLIDLKKVSEAKAISHTPDGGWKIGAAVSGAAMKDNADLCRDWPGVVEGMNLVGSTQVQGRATLAGNLCNGSPAADSVPGLVAAGARAVVIGPSGQREVTVESLPVGPGRTSLQPGEVIAAILLPPRGNQNGDAYLRFIPRTEMDIAVAGCAVNLRLDGDRIVEARVALGAVAPTVRLAPEAAAALLGSTADTAALDALATAAEAACSPISDKRGTAEFRRNLAGVLARRATIIAYNRAKGAH
jgi:xanthine dehydrogenase FAD-binding subunit